MNRSRSTFRASNRKFPQQIGEREVLRGMAQGLSNQEIARQFGLTIRTVEFHVGNILQKLGVVSRLEAVLWAREHGFLPGRRE